MPKEIWLPVKGHEGEYEVSSLGRVRSIGVTAQRVSSTGRPYMIKWPSKILSPGLSGRASKQYLAVNIKGRLVKVHRLVAQAFCGEPKPEVNHKNANKLDNRAVNLEWVTRKENAEHAKKNGLLRPPSQEQKWVPVVATCITTGKEHEFHCINEAARVLLGDVKKQAPISHCVSGKHKSAYGYTWRKKI